jgi:hypothetical protein
MSQAKANAEGYGNTQRAGGNPKRLSLFSRHTRVA